MKLRYVIEIEPFVSFDEDEAYKYYGGIITRRLENSFNAVKIYSYKGGERGK